MFKINSAILISTLATTLVVLNQQQARALKFNFTVRDFDDNTIETGFFEGEDTNNDGILSFSEFTDFFFHFEGNSEVSAFQFIPSDIATSQDNSVAYDYGDSFSDTSDDISFDNTLFLADPVNDLFISKIGKNNYLSGSAETTLAQFSSDEFSEPALGSTTSNTLFEIELVTTVPETQPLSIFGVAVALGLGAILKKQLGVAK